MPNFTYISDIPDAPHNPSIDQPDMKINNNSNEQIWDVDHYGFNDNKGGTHEKVTLSNLGVAPGFAGGDGALYNISFNGQSWPVWQNALGSTIMVNHATSSTGNGYCSLPGGLLLQWGSSGVSFSTTGSINFNIPFGVGFNPIVTIAQFATSGTPSNSLYLIATNANNFTYRNASSTVNAIHWHAIGPVA